MKNQKKSKSSINIIKTITGFSPKIDFVIYKTLDGKKKDNFNLMISGKMCKIKGSKHDEKKISKDE